MYWKNANTLRMNNGSETDRIREREREREKENMHNILLARKWLNHSSGSQLKHLQSKMILLHTVCNQKRVYVFHLVKERALGSAGIKSRSFSLRLTSLEANPPIHTAAAHVPEMREEQPKSELTGPSDRAAAHVLYCSVPPTSINSSIHSFIIHNRS